MYGEEVLQTTNKLVLVAKAIVVSKTACQGSSPCNPASLTFSQKEKVILF